MSKDTLKYILEEYEYECLIWLLEKWVELVEIPVGKSGSVIEANNIWSVYGLAFL